MRIFAICVVKNEVDVIGFTLERAANWAHKIFVLDNGSTDGTWETVKDMANEVIIPWKTTTQPFYEGIRSEVFNEFKHLAKNGDWWCYRLDADEVYIDDPRYFLLKVPEKFHVVYKKSIDYFITHEDLEEQNFRDSFELNVEHIRYFSPISWSEGRFFKHRDKLIWETNSELPKRIGIIYPQHILVKHYQYRSPEQMQKRLDIRNESKTKGPTLDGTPRFAHIKEKSWQELLRYRSELILDSGMESYNRASCVNNKLTYSIIGYLYRRVMHSTGLWP